MLRFPLLLRFPLRLPVTRPRFSVMLREISALQLAEQRGCGKVVSEQVMRRLLDGGSDAPLQGLMTILLTSPDRRSGGFA